MTLESEGGRSRMAWLVGLVTLVALAVRLPGLNGGMWIDEIYSLLRSFRPPLSQIVTEFWGDNQHPLYAILAHLSISVFGESPWSVRLPAMLFGVASVPMLYALGLCVASRREALLAAALLAVSYHHVWFSQNARGYSAMAFFALLATWALLRGMREGRMGFFVLYGVTAALGAYTHLTMVFVVAGHALACLIALIRPDPSEEMRADWRGPLLGIGLAGILSLAMYAPIALQVVDFFLNRPSPLKGVSTPGWALGEGLRVLQFGLSGGVAVIGGLVLAAGGALVLTGVLSYARQSRFTLLAFFLPAVVTVLGALAARGTMYPRFFFFMIGIGMLIVVRGAYVTAAWFGRRLRGGDGQPLAGRLATGAVVALIVVSTATLARNYRYPKQDFEGAMRFVLAQKSASDQVASSGLPWDPYRTLYHQPWPNVSTLDELAKARSHGGRTWLLYTFPRYLEQRAPDVAALIRTSCPVARVFPGTVGGGDIVVCILEPA